MQFRTQQMDLTKALDEVFLRLLLLGLRIFQALISLPVLAFAAALINDFSNQASHIPSKATAIEAIACACVVYISLVFFPIFFGGALFFTIVTVLDVLFLIAWIVSVAIWDIDGSNTCHAFEEKYFAGLVGLKFLNTDCKLMKAMFAFSIINLALFIASSVTSFCLRIVELNHVGSWDRWPIVGRRGGHECPHECPHCIHHHQDSRHESHNVDLRHDSHGSSNQSADESKD